MAAILRSAVSSARICNQEKVPNLCATELLRSNAIGPRMAEHAIYPVSISSLNPEEVAEWDAGEPALPYSPEEPRNPPRIQVSYVISSGG